ncbi:type-1 angiotensin II receptor-associated protein isoform X2 [Pleurodeles waltl]|uniref:type-1 angiotensin II receptor-associated protein isoform X2 n=1 Tax=Pleurodeles waltl TaxID=8319 RepID=UPI003709A6FF
MRHGAAGGESEDTFRTRWRRISRPVLKRNDLFIRARMQLKRDCPRTLASDCLFLVGLLLTILTDIIHFSVFFAATSNAAEKQGIEDFFRFSAGMAILSLILKPLSCFFVYFMYRERGGEHNLNFGFFTAPQDRSAYQSIDQQDAPTDQDSKMPQRQY